MERNSKTLNLENPAGSKCASDPYHLALERLVTVVQELSLARDLEEIIAIVRDAARELTGADGATFILREGDQSYYVDENAIRPLWKGKRFPMDRCLGGWAMMNREPVVVENVYSDERIPVETYYPTFVKSLAVVPIRKKNPIGAIGSYWKEENRASPEAVKILQSLADITSVAMENVQLYSELETRVRQRTEELEKSTEILREQASLLDLAYDAIVVRDLKANDAIIYWSKGAEKTYGFSREEAMGKVPRELLKTRFPAAAEQIEKELFEMEQWKGELVHTTRSGASIVVASRWALQRDAAGNPNAILEINRDITEGKKAQEALKQSERQLRYLSSQLLGVQEKERKRIANEIHDSVGQSLHVIRTGLQGLVRQTKEKATARACEDLIRTVDFAKEEVQNIYMDLRPSLLDDLGLLPAVSWFVRESQTAYPDTSVREEIHIEEDEIPESLKIIIFRVLQAAMDNVAQHSKADTALIRLGKRDGRIELTIEDNGIGFSQPLQQEPQERLGLATMQERVESSGGIFTVKSARGEGTVIRASWDINRMPE